MDPFSSGPSFTGWIRVDGYLDEFPATYEPLAVSRPQTWLLTAGWKRHGLLSATAVPGAAAQRSVA